MELEWYLPQPRPKTGERCGVPALIKTGIGHRR